MLSDCVVWTYWTDSTSVLSWIKSDPGRWKPFVLNCLREIQHITRYADWGHCPGNWVILRICGVQGCMRSHLLYLTCGCMYLYGYVK